MSDNQQSRLVADVGGTNTRLALSDPAAGQLRKRTSYLNRDYATLEEVIAHWLGALGEPIPRNCCMAVAAAIFEDQVTMVNMDWTFSCKTLAERFGFEKLRCINDFEGNAYALPHLSNVDQELIHPGKADPARSGRLATIGPGTGLGGAILDRRYGTDTAFACEPGHMGLSAGTLLELELFRVLLARHPDIHAELLVSGPGLKRLYQTLGEINGEATEPLSPPDISQRALDHPEGLCALALDTFCALLGSVSGDFLLANGAYGGLYLAGGIVPQISAHLRRSPFQSRLITKGAMSELLDTIPVYIITTDHPGLIGAAHAPL